MSQFCIVKTRTESLPQEGQLLSEINRYTYALLIGNARVEFVKGEEVSSLDWVTEVRAFNETGELHLVRIDGRFIGRFRIDGEGENTECFDEQQYLWGKTVSCENGVSLLHEDRGIDIRVPVEARKGERVRLKVRSYLDTDSLTFTDWRLCGVLVGKEA